MKLLCVIPARFGSTRLDGKPLLDLGGKSLIQRVVERVSSAEVFDKIIVATDDIRILDHVIELGYDAEMTSTDHASGTDRCAEVASRNMEFDFVVNVQGDEPMIEIDLLQTVRQTLAESIGDMILTAATPMSEEQIIDPNKVKVVLGEAGRAVYFSRAVVPYPRNRSAEIIYYRHIGLYAFPRRLLLEVTQLPPCKLEMTESLEQLRWIANGYKMRCIVGDWKGFGIDSPKDAEEFIRSLS